MVWFRGRVARQRSAKPFTAVRIRSKPPFLADKMQFNAFCPLFSLLKITFKLNKACAWLVRSQTLHRVGNGCLYGLDTYGDNGDGHSRHSRCYKYPGTDSYPVIVI